MSQNTTSPSYGMGNQYLQTSMTIERTMFTFAGVGLYNMIELLVMIPLRFNSWKGLYFWSLVLSTFGLLPYTLGLLFKFFGPLAQYPGIWVAITMVDVGWQLIVTGQSLVLYSRLHLVCRNATIRRACLWMIIVNWFISNVPTTVFVFGASSPNPGPFNKPYAVWERLQLALYFVQETALSGIYVFEITKLLKPDIFNRQTSALSGRTVASASSFIRKMRTKTSKRVLRHLLWINAIILILDISLLGIEYSGYYDLQVLYKAMVYSVKLKMEFKILNQLTDIAQERLRSSQQYFSENSQRDDWDDDTSPNDTQGRRASSRTVTPTGSRLASPMREKDSPFGALLDPEKGAETDIQAANNESVDKVEPIGDVPKPFLPAHITKRLQETRRPGYARGVSFTEGMGPSTRKNHLELEWEELMND